MAPALIALTAFSVSTYAVMKSTTLLGLCFNILSNHSYPSSPLIASRWKFMSSIMTLGSKESMNSRIRSGVVVTLIASTYGFKSILSDKSTSSLSSTINIFPHFSVAMLLSICSVCFFGGGLSGFLSWCQMSKILTTYLFAKVIFWRHTRKGKTQEIGAGVYK